MTPPNPNMNDPLPSGIKGYSVVDRELRARAADWRAKGKPNAGDQAHAAIRRLGIHGADALRYATRLLLYRAGETARFPTPPDLPASELRYIEQRLDQTIGRAKRAVRIALELEPPDETRDVDTPGPATAAAAWDPEA